MVVLSQLGSSGSTVSPRDRYERRLSDIVLLAVTLPVVLIILFLHIQVVLNGGSTIPTMRVDFAPMPVVLDINRDHIDNIRVGDRILKIGNVDTSSISPIQFKLTIASQLSQQDKIPVQLKREGELHDGFLLRRIQPFAWALLPMITTFLVVATLVLWQAPHSPRARTFFIGFASLAVFQSSIEAGSEWQIMIGMFLFVVVGLVSLTCILLWVIGFPRSLNSEDRSWQVPNWVAFVVALIWMSPRLNYYLSGPFPADSYDTQTYAINVFLFLFIIATLSWNYQCVDAANKRRTRWVLLGVYLALVPNILIRTIGLWLDESTFEIIYNIGRFFYVAFPVSIWIAIANFRLYDVDRVFGGAITYTILVVLLALGAEAVLEPIAGFIAERAGFDAGIGQLIFVGALAALAVPIRTIIKPMVDAVILARHKPFTKAMTELMSTLSNEETKDFSEIATAAAAKTATTLGAHTCVLVLKTDQLFNLRHGFRQFIDKVSRGTGKV